MEKVTIRGEKLTVHEMPVRAGLPSEWEKDAHRVIRDTVSHARDILYHLGEEDSFEWSHRRELIQAMGGEQVVYPLLCKPVRQSAKWVEALETKELAHLALAVYEANKGVFGAIFDADFGPAEAFERMSVNEAFWKLAEYGYSDAEVVQIPIDELRNLYQDVARIDLKKREEFLRLLPNILGMPQFQEMPELQENEQCQKS